MIAANEAVAAELSSHELPAIYRVHDPTEPRRPGVSSRGPQGRWVSRRRAISSRCIPRPCSGFFESVEGSPKSLCDFMTLRAMQRAVYHPDCRGHYALSSRTTPTSLRRSAAIPIFSFIAS